MIDGRNSLNQPVKRDLKIHKITTGQGDDCITSYLLNYPYFKKYYKMIEVDLSKQQGFEFDPKAISKSRMCRKYNNFFHYSKSKRKYFWFFTRKC